MYVLVSFKEALHKLESREGEGKKKKKETRKKKKENKQT